MNNTVSIVVFSKDRACQLEACLRSLFLSMRTGVDYSVSVLYRASEPLYAGQYESLKTELPQVRFVEEGDFEKDLWHLLLGSQYSLFVVDDCLFSSAWSLDECCSALDERSEAVGFSLRLGKNIIYCYPMQCSQRQPAFESFSGHVLQFDWTTAEYDFGYPIEVSSSLYRTSDMETCLKDASFSRPNELEREMYRRIGMFRESHPKLLCFDQSVAFACPVNITQEVKSNCHGLEHPFDAEELAREYDRGLRIDLEPLKGFVPISCHQEIPIRLIELTG